MDYPVTVAPRRQPAAENFFNILPPEFLKTPESLYPKMFIPATRNEMAALGWKQLDVILVTGDSYIDSPHIGVALIGKTLMAAGFRVGIIPQPDVLSEEDILRFGEPELFWGVTAGCMDSMIANYTAAQKRRRSDDLTAGGKNTRRPDRASIVYANLIRRHFKHTKPIVLGGIEASLRRISHYDLWSDSVRRSILFDAKADFLVYGMGEKTVAELAERMQRRQPVTDIRGLCYISKDAPPDYIGLPPHESVAKSKDAFAQMFRLFYDNCDPADAQGLYQKQDTRYLVQNPPPPYPAPEELDRIYELGYERRVHPLHKDAGEVRAIHTIGFSIASHRGCFGGCHFCAIAVHEGRRVISRTEASILREAEKMTQHPDFKGIIPDLGGPTANMYGMSCKRAEARGICRNKACLVPAACKTLDIHHQRQIELLRNLRRIPGIKKVFIGSGVRHDLVLQDRQYGLEYLKEISAHHVSGQLKIAPEHSQAHVLRLMGKPDSEYTQKFIEIYTNMNRALKKKQYLTCYFMAAYPGCTETDMVELHRFIARFLKFTPRQVQVFTPGPSTIATLLYYTQKDIFTGKPLFVETDLRKKENQKKRITVRR